ncbi:sensor histidine kinase [Aquimarina rhabdastrellae]
MYKYTINGKQFLIHTLCWGLFVSFVGIQLYLDLGRIPRGFLSRLTINLGIFYMNYLFLVPQLLLKKRALIYVFSAISLIYISKLITDHVINDVELYINAVDVTGKFIDRRFFFNRFSGKRFSVLFYTTFLILSLAIRLYEEWKRNENNRRVIQADKTATELQFLKNQLNPHFLFNSLNSIYSLTTKKSNDAPEAVITLSEMMRYMLYQTNNKFVLLQNELNYIQNYLKLQRLRIANNEKVTINIHGTVSNQKIKPLLLISFIENAFKYGTDFKGNTEVRISIDVEETKLYFKCINLIGVRKHINNDFGIGLQNTRERLELLYPEKHELSVEEKENKYIVDLVLNLKE